MMSIELNLLNRKFGRCLGWSDEGDANILVNYFETINPEVIPSCAFFWINCQEGKIELYADENSEEPYKTLDLGNTLAKLPQIKDY